MLIGHTANIISKKIVTAASVTPGVIIEFRYKAENKKTTDKQPLVFVLAEKGEVAGAQLGRTKKGFMKGRGSLLKGGSFSGINLHYLPMNVIERLVLEKNLVKLKNWKMYQKAFRSYSIEGVKALKLVEFKTYRQMAEEKKAIQSIEGNEPEQPEPPQQPKKP